MKLVTWNVRSPYRAGSLNTVAIIQSKLFYRPVSYQNKCYVLN
jgi:hypothetical protein